MLGRTLSDSRSAQPVRSDTPIHAAASAEHVVPGDLGEYLADLRVAFLIRLTEERLLSLFNEGKLFGTVHTCIGQEFASVAVGRSLVEADTVFSNHRCHGHFLAYRPELEGLIAELMGKATGVCGGRGGSQHLQLDGFYSNGVLGGTVPVAVGQALAHQRAHSGGIAVAFIGDGTMGEGALYESMNIAARWKLPLLIVCENNGIAQSTPQEQTLAGTMRARAEAFGIPTALSDTWNWRGLFSDIRRSVDTVRRGDGPVFHQVDTYRLMAHSKGDDTRSKDEVEPFRQRDPLNTLLREHSDEPWLSAMLAMLRRRIDEAVTAADAAPFAQLEPLVASARPTTWQRAEFESRRVVDSIYRGLAHALDSDDRVIVIGEDIEGPYGGAFKCTRDLSQLYPERVRNTPISEAGIVGVGGGLALSGYRPVVEIMFGDFLTLATDQWINYAAKFEFMYGGKVRVPLVIRTPMGGKRGYGPTHSQSLEKHFLGVPGTRVLALHHRYPPEDVLGALFEAGDRPTLIIENKLLYGRTVSAEAPAGFTLHRSDGTFPTMLLEPEVEPQLTILAIGGIAADAEAALVELFVEHEISAELLLPIELYPFDVASLASRIHRTRRLLVVEEGQSFASFSSEVVAQAAEQFGRARLACRRVTAWPVPIPSARPLEEVCLPDRDAIVRAALDLMNESLD